MRWVEGWSSGRLVVGNVICLCEYGDGRWRGREIVGPNGTVLVQSGERSCGDGDLLAGSGKGISHVPSTSNSTISVLVLFMGPNCFTGTNSKDLLWVRGKLFKQDSRARQRRLFLGNKVSDDAALQARNI